MPYFTAAELRAAYPRDLAGAANIAKYPDTVLVAKIATAEQTIEDACDVAFLPRPATRDITDVYRPGLLVLPHKRVRTITAASGSTTGILALTDVRIVNGYVKRASGWPTDETITVTYTHGYDTPPLRILDAAKLYAKTLVIKGPVDDRATQMPGADGGVINLLTPGQRGSITGIPEVDAAITQFQERTYFA